MKERDEDRRIEEELARREQADLRSRAEAPMDTPLQAPQQQKDREADPQQFEVLLHRFRAELDDMEGRTVAAIDAVAERVAPVTVAAAELSEWIKGAAARSEAVDRLAPLLEEAVDRQNRLHRPARRRARAVGLLLALALTAALALFVQWRFAIIETPDPTHGWRDHLWERYGPELRDCVIQVDGQGKAMLCQIFDPEPALPLPRRPGKG